MPRSPDSVRSLLLFDVLADDGDRGAAAGRGEVARAPQHTLPEALGDVPAVPSQEAAGEPFRLFTRPETGTLGGCSTNKWTWSSSPSISTRRASKSRQTDRAEDLSQPFDGRSVEHVAAVLGYEDQVHVQVEDTMPAVPDFALGCHRASI